MAKIILEREKCIGCTACVTACPALFEMAKDGLATLKKSKKKKDGFELEVKKATGDMTEAANACPVQIITVKKD